MSAIVSSHEMKFLEQSALATGTSEEELMEQAGSGLAQAIAARWPEGGNLVVFAGKGHNAADALVAARELLDSGSWQVEVRLAVPMESIKPLTRHHLHELGTVRIIPLDAPAFGGRVVLLDGLLGIGADGTLSEEFAIACRKMNAWAAEFRAEIIAVDIPTGLKSREGVIADCTVTFGFAKDALLEDEATERVGRMLVVPLVELTEPPDRDFVITAPWVRASLPQKRKFSLHKAQAGRVGIVAGGPGCLGAARLAALAAVRTGAGLVSLYVPESLYEMIATAAAPEIMVKTFRQLPTAQADAWGIGPGLGTDSLKDIFAWIDQLTAPAVLDADALNWLSLTGLCALEKPPGKRLLTPHPGEMKRLLAHWRPELSQQSRAEQARKFTATFPVTLLLKGSRTLLAERDHPIAYNTTGTSNMASGGMGDILTGVCATLLAQGLEPFAAGAVGSWILGRAGELAARKGYGASLVAEEISSAIASSLH